MSPDVPAGAALVTVLARRLRGTVAVLTSRAEALDREQEPDRLRRLAELHEAIGRLDRYCDSLLALAGVPFGRPEPEPVDLLSLLAAAASAVERHTRVELGSVDGGVAVSGWVAAHARHAVSELLDNATCFSPPGSPVTLDASLVDAGLLVRVVDRGVGIGPERLAELNRLLGAPPALDPDTLRASGLPVVAVLAGWYGWTVRLDSRPRGGTVAELLLPPTALAEPGRTADARPSAHTGAAGGPPGSGTAGAGTGTFPARRPPSSRRASGPDDGPERPAVPQRPRDPVEPVQVAPEDTTSAGGAGSAGGTGSAGGAGSAGSTAAGRSADAAGSADVAGNAGPVGSAGVAGSTGLAGNAGRVGNAGRAGPDAPPRDPLAVAAALAGYQRARPAGGLPPAPAPWRPARSPRGRMQADRAQGTTQGDIAHE